ncbi:unnamed protein product [Spirodela intermedia]|uniref:AB hydrolase-1 domain-containing protein n=1 Tax=Spirodela intermedia TaxID=51605 RepID=A0A7I8J200_SPIIN|nr:unnamed protein product [Spirodela intermedia]CAA6663340.1 unnamed protein product [Spirodela intermedia]
MRLAHPAASPQSRPHLFPSAPPTPPLIGGAAGALLHGAAGGQGLRLTPYDVFPILGWNNHLETIFAAFFRSVPEVCLRRECIRTIDDGSVALDWCCGDSRLLPADAPVLILLPGLTGGSGDSYVRHMLLKARSKGWRVVVFNSRGCGDSPVTTAQLVWSRGYLFTRDLSEVINHVSSRYPKSKIYAVGWSLGANILVRYLGQLNFSICTKVATTVNAYPLIAGISQLSYLWAVSLCNPFNLVIADEDFHKGFNNVYDKALAGALRRIFKSIHSFSMIYCAFHAYPLDMGGEYNIPLAANAQSVRDFDEALTRVSFGFKSVDDYYFNSSSSDSIKDVRTPLLCIQAANDPIAPSRGIPRDEIQANPHCLLIVTPQGGHLGWLAGSEAPFGAPWTDTVVMDFLELLHTTVATGDLNVGGDMKSHPPVAVPVQ